MTEDDPIVPESDGRHKGFAGPNYTQVPNEIMDRWLPDLTGAELKILLYLARRTFGFHRDRVEVGLRRICDGIPAKDRGTGLHVETASAAVRSLEAKGLVIPERRPGGTHHIHPARYRAVRKIRTPVFGNSEQEGVRKTRTRRKKVIIRKKHRERKV